MSPLWVPWVSGGSLVTSGANDIAQMVEGGRDSQPRSCHCWRSFSLSPALMQGTGSLCPWAGRAPALYQNLWGRLHPRGLQLCWAELGYEAV